MENLSARLAELQTQALDWLQTSLDFVGRTPTLIQLGMVVLAYVFALLISWRVEPRLEEQVRKIRGKPNLLRVLAAFLRRLEWLFFVILLGLAYVATGETGWPGANYIIYSVMLLAAAWLLIRVFSAAIRNRTVGRVFSWVAWVYVAATILGLTDDVARLLDGAGFNITEGPPPTRLSLLTVLQGVLLLAALLWAASAVGNFLDRRIQSAEDLTPSLRVLLGKVLRITLITAAALIAISSIGVDLTALTVLSGAVGVGIGFGLQKVVSNFISGIIILMDQSIKPGDTISLGETFGWIRELRARFVSVVTRDGREFLIPNEDFITTQVVNWSFTDKLVRLDVAFGVAYDSDPHEVTRLAIEAAGSVDRVVTELREPVCWLTEFGDSSLNFLLRFWISDPQSGLTNIRGKVLLALWDSFKENDINIPFPHREVIMKTPVEAIVRSE